MWFIDLRTVVICFHVLLGVSYVMTLESNFNFEFVRLSDINYKEIYKYLISDRNTITILHSSDAVFNCSLKSINAGLKSGFNFNFVFESNFISVFESVLDRFRPHFVKFPEYGVFGVEYNHAWDEIQDYLFWLERDRVCCPKPYPNLYTYDRVFPKIRFVPGGFTFDIHNRW